MIVNMFCIYFSSPSLGLEGQENYHPVCFPILLSYLIELAWHPRKLSSRMFCICYFTFTGGSWKKLTIVVFIFFKLTLTWMKVKCQKHEGQSQEAQSVPSCLVSSFHYWLKVWLEYINSKLTGTQIFILPEETIIQFVFTIFN